VGRSDFLDKWKVAHVLRDLGLRAPDTLLADATSPAEAIKKFSLPIVLKRRVSSSGAGVKIFHTLETLLTFFEQIENLSEWFFERYTQGRSFVCAGWVGDDGIDVMATYETLKRIKQFGSSMVVEFQNDMGIVETGKYLINSMGIRGFVCFDVIRDANGVDWIHDVNPRLFGSFSTCQLFGFDFCNAYVDWLLGRGSTTPSQFEFYEARAFIFPFALKEVLQSGPSGASPLRALHWAWMNWKFLGSRFFISLAIRGVVYAYMCTKQRLRSLRRTPSERKFNLLPPTM
jgi:biotin carboxylase